jgi:hypothetical protein
MGIRAVSGRCRTIRQISLPLRTGRFRSRMTRSGGCSVTTRRASSPRWTISTNASPDRSSVCLISAAMSCSSSTTRIRGGVMPAARPVGPGRTGMRCCHASTRDLLDLLLSFQESLGALGFPRVTRVLNACCFFFVLAGASSCGVVRFYRGLCAFRGSCSARAAVDLLVPLRVDSGGEPPSVAMCRTEQIEKCPSRYAHRILF